MKYIVHFSDMFSPLGFHFGLQCEKVQHFPGPKVSVSNVAFCPRSSRTPGVNYLNIQTQVRMSTHYLNCTLLSTFLRIVFVGINICCGTGLTFPLDPMRVPFGNILPHVLVSTYLGLKPKDLAKTLVRSITKPVI